jgi:hypothetical protein
MSSTLTLEFINNIKPKVGTRGLHSSLEHP